MRGNVTHGVSKFDGPTLGGWYAWARKSGTYAPFEGPVRLFKWRARLDERRLVRKLRGQP